MKFSGHGAQSQRRRREQARVDHLLQEVDASHKCGRIRAYLRAVVWTAEEETRSIDPEGELGHWLAWANSVADGFDSLRPTEDGDAGKVAPV